MASPNLFLSILLASHVILSMPSPSFECALPCESEVINLLLYEHQVVCGPDVNQITTHNSPQASKFGMTAINDWVLFDALPPKNTSVVARAKGMHFQADVAGPGWFVYYSMVFQGGRFSGSSFQVMGIMGITSPDKEGQLSIIGGTGELAMARGVIKYKALRYRPDPKCQNVFELNIHAFYVPATGSTAGAAIL